MESNPQPPRKEENGKLNSKDQGPVFTTGAVSGGADNLTIDFAALMNAHKKHKGMNKSHNHKEAKKANIRRHEKYEREAQKEYNERMQEEIEAENKKWAPVDKEDEKFQKKMANKLKDKGPSNKEVNA